ncbi:sulfotransferase family 2 domain-containing protein [Allorhodopirellula heiligendammensis]|uniref:Galactose-3-O-sulfotransferase n=1 Tax=Allorhodopirellula heiligendammensis TaxID=2714739 RepID=A0A5C6BYM2_9BACT|nr:sulfotransferase family 2 domain-containing protein [Allorhodopirellula heiligendammensis]TWU16988.1 Galactose-3-O-sulfotransferase [Allorhodopirellula heiligendammensis]
MNQPVCFVHIPKTAGTTFNFILSREYASGVRIEVPSNELSLVPSFLARTPKEQISKASLIRGHFGYGVHQLVEGGVRYLTFLRDPANRLKSYIYHMRHEAEVHHDKGGWWYESARKRTPLKDYASEFQDKCIDNDQVRRVAGIDFDFGKCNQAILDIAKSNLDNKFTAFGLLERFDESLIAMSHVLRWSKTPRYYVVKRRNRRLATEPLSSQDIECIDRLTIYDQLLYDHAKLLFEESTSTINHLAAKTFALKTQNTLTAPGLKIAHQTWRHFRSS